MTHISEKWHKAVEIRIGTAGWTLSKLHARHFSASTSEEKLSHLERYASVLRCTEVNSSFHRAHLRKTWERWAASTPAEFRFAVKIPKTVTHEAKLVKTGALLKTFLEQASGLGCKLGPLLVQLPPKLAFDEGLAHEFFTTLRELHPAEDSALRQNSIVLEPRHATWFTPEVDRLLRSFEIARVAADPAKGSSLAASPAGSPHLRYYRLHGSPRTYYSDYTPAFLESFAKKIHTEEQTLPPPTWVIFDNTALGHATGNALQLQRLCSHL